MDFDQALQEIQNLHSSLQRKLDAATKAELKLRAKVGTVTDVCTPICANAAEEYNRTTHLHIMPSSIRIGIAASAKKIDMSVRLQYAGGHEPDEDLSDADFSELVSGFRNILDDKLRVAGIPLSMGTLFIPPCYYPK